MKLLPATMVASTAAALVLIGVTPAHAAGNPLDEGDALYSISCDPGVNEFQLFAVDATTAFSTPIGTGTAPAHNNYCASQPAYDATTGTSYYVQWVYDAEIQYNYSRLAIIDLATGASTVIDDFFKVIEETAEVVAVDVDAIAIGNDGAAFAVENGALYALNLATAELAYIDHVREGDQEVGGFFAFAADPVTGKFYFSTSSGDLFELNVLTGAATFLGHIGVTEGYVGVYSLQFDGGGQFWIEEDDEWSNLWSFTLDTLATPVFSGEFTDDPYYTRAILIVPGEVAKPALAATGAEVPLAAAGIAGMLALSGAALLLGRRRAA